MTRPSSDRSSRHSQEHPIRITGSLVRGLQTGLLLVALACILAELAEVYWLFELTSHFRMLYAYIALVAAVVLGFARKPLWFGVALSLLLANSPHLFPYVFPKLSANLAGQTALANPAAASAAGRLEVRLLLANVQRSNDRYASLVDYLQRHTPDVLVLQEVDGRWAQALETLEDLYPHRFVIARPDSFGMALYSRWPLSQERLKYFPNSQRPNIVAQLTVEGRKLSLLASHPVPPLGPGFARERNAQLSGMAGFMAEQKQPSLLLGDLNLTPWSPYYEQLLQRGQLHSPRPDMGLMPTWPSFLPEIFRIPIDHILYSHHWRLLSFRRGEDIGSDHYPLHARLVLTPQS